DQVIEWSTGSSAPRAWRRLDPARPPRANGRPHAVKLCEYGAQAMAVHGGLRASTAGGTARPGLLVGLRAVELLVERIDDLPGDLECEAELLMESPAGWQYRFTLRHAGTLLATGESTVMPT